MIDDEETTGKRTATQRRRSRSDSSSANGDELDEIYVRLADSVAVLNSTRLADGVAEGPAGNAAIWSAPAGEAEEPEYEDEELAGQEGIDDPVRMYLREIEQGWVNERGEGPTGSEILFSLLQQLHDERRALNAVIKSLNIKKRSLSELVVNE